MIDKVDTYLQNWLEELKLYKEKEFTENELKELFSFKQDFDKRKESSNWVQYINGNYIVEINKSTGTKIRTAPFDSFEAKFPENIDMKITNWCDMGCAFCHENSNKEGKHATLFAIDGCTTAGTYIKTLLDSLHPGTELAIGGGKVTSHPDLEELLLGLKRRGVFANITVHQKEYALKSDIIKKWIKDGIVKGVGISWSRDGEYQIDSEYAAKNYPNVVLHTIAGITTLEDYRHISEATNKKAKVLILGYKDFRRGHLYKQNFRDKIDNNIEELSNNLKELFDLFEVVSFDNLALNQLRPDKLLTQEQWDTFYQGQDSNHTMYVDLVNMTYAGHSTTPENERFNIFNENGIAGRRIHDMFEKVKGTVHEQL